MRARETLPVYAVFCLQVCAAALPHACASKYASNDPHVQYLRGTAADSQLHPKAGTK